MNDSWFKPASSRSRREFSGPSHVNQLLRESPLGDLLERARQLRDLDRVCRNCLPKTLQNHCHIINFAERNLVISAPSPVWAARLRLQSRGLLRCLRQKTGLPLDGIRVKILPEDAPRPAEPRKMARLTSASSNQVARVARDICDPELRSALLRLAAKAATGE